MEDVIVVLLPLLRPSRDEVTLVTGPTRLLVERHRFPVQGDVGHDEVLSRVPTEQPRVVHQPGTHKCPVEHGQWCPVPSHRVRTPSLLPRVGRVGCGPLYRPYVSHKDLVNTVDTCIQKGMCTGVYVQECVGSMGTRVDIQGCTYTSVCTEGSIKPQNSGRRTTKDEHSYKRCTTNPWETRMGNLRCVPDTGYLTTHSPRSWTRP